MIDLPDKAIKILALALDDAAKIGEWKNAAVMFIGALRKSGTGIEAFNEPRPQPPAWKAPAWSPPKWKRETTMPFGKYQGQPLSAVPTAYLEWLCRTAQLRPFLKKSVVDELTRRYTQ